MDTVIIICISVGGYFLIALLIYFCLKKYRNKERIKLDNNKLSLKLDDIKVILQ